MNYRHVYMLIIEHAKKEVELGLRPKSSYQRKNFPNQYFEFHHILPRSLFPLWIKRKSNLVPLTAREHFFCHQLLTKIYPCREMYFAINAFIRTNSGRFLSSRAYAYIRHNCMIHNCSTYASKEVLHERSLKAANTRRQNYDSLSTQEKENLHILRSKRSKEIAKNRTAEEKLKIAQKRAETFSKKTIEERQAMIQKRLDNINWEEFSDSVRVGLRSMTNEEREHRLKLLSEKSKNYWSSLSDDEYEKLCLSRKELATKRNLGRRWFTNGSTNKFCYECPNGYWEGMTKTNNSSFKNTNIQYKCKNAVKERSIAYKEYKLKGGALSWNEFQKEYK
jgi:hypothetical protein